ncbi:hypothetical protein SDC9_177689 [bioreactor metagenome]|uniref:Uncharacterized protein n=1 Tax=bioreactor metagenome TaxID=1076179 RepID=A0A645GVE1_9ZZZZ
MVFAGIPVAAGIGKSLHIQRVAAKHTAHCIGDQRHDFIVEGADIAAALHGFRHIVLACKHSMHRDVLVRHLRRQLVLQAIYVNKNAVEFFLVGLELLKPLLTFRLPYGEFI